MAVKKGYKQTEVGLIPEDWGVIPLGKCLIENPAYGINAPAISYDSRYPTYLRITDITEDGRIDESSKASVNHLSSQAYILKEGDLVFARTGASVGKSYLYKKTDGILVYAGFLIKIRPDKERLIANYLFFYSQSRNYWNWIRTNSMRSGQPGVNGKEYASLPIPLPATTAEQTAIATALSDADALIESLEQLIAKKRQIKQGAMQELLTGKKRLPGFSGEWEVRRLGDLGTCYRGVSYNPSAHLSECDTESTVRLLRSNNVQESKIVFENMQFVDSSRVSDVQRLRSNDILICMANGSRALVGKSGRFDNSDGFEYTFGAFMGCFRPDVSLANQEFVYFIFQTEKYRQHIDVLLAGSSINNLRPSEVESLEIDIPADREEQSAIAAILSDMDADIAALEEKLNKARAVKQGMMQELLTGRIRLPLGQLV